MSTVSKIPSITIGGHTITDIENLVVLSGSGGATAVGIFLALYKDGEPSPYQVPVTHNLRVFGVRFKDTNQSRWGY